MSDIFDLDLFPCMAGFTPDFAQTTQIFLSVRDEPSPISSPGPWFPFQPHVEFRKLASGSFCSDSIRICIRPKAEYERLSRFVYSELSSGRP